MKPVTILTFERGEDMNAFLRKLKKLKGDVLVIISFYEAPELKELSTRQKFIEALKDISSRVRLATRSKPLVAHARENGIRVIDRPNDLEQLLKDHSKRDEAMRVFSPHVWRKELRSRLQATGLLSMPRIRVWLFIGVSCVLFYFVLFRLLPNATIRVSPREEVITQTANIFLVLSGSTVDIPDRVRTMELVPIEVSHQQTVTFDEISKEFIGTSASVPMTVTNNTDESYSLRKGSRLANGAGMIFRIQEGIIVRPNDTVTVIAVADDEDLYGQIIGERGNVPAGVRWNFIGLPEDEQFLVYAENKVSATGGVTDYRTVLQERDLTLASAQLKDELLSYANQLVDEEIELMNARNPEKVVARLYYDELTQTSFSGFVLPQQFLGEAVATIPVEGTIYFRAFAYDSQRILEMLNHELETHVEEGKRLLPETVKLERLITHVIDYEDDLSWIKLTVDLSGIEEAILDPLTPSGAQFGKQVRDRVLGVSREEAMRILRNLPEVEKVDVSLWPPWSSTLPHIPSHIYIEVTQQL